ncbi:MAG: 3-deoxy-manno-octulosonate cytidylyltransferase [Mangrovibacterium sp.]
MNYLAIIPARYQSTRFPGKPLKKLAGKFIIHHVYEKASQCFENVWVATDDNRIAQAVDSFGGKVVLTSPEHLSGTDRVAEAAFILKKQISFDVVVNIQGDEPFVCKEQLEALKLCFDDKNTQIATLIKLVEDDDTLFNSNRPKVVFDQQNFAMLFSRSTIPYLRGVEPNEWLKNHHFFYHLGMYAYRESVLQELTSLRPSALECAESLEQLRWLENGYKIKIAETKHESIGIDTPEDLLKAQDFWHKTH